jgi:type I restriction enzyme M protein
LQSIDGHLNGGMPRADVDSLSLYWQTFPKLRKSLFKPLRKGFYSLPVEKDAIRDTINKDSDFSAYADKVETAFQNWKKRVDRKLRAINDTTKPKLLIAEIAGYILVEYEPITLVDKYDAYEVLLTYWNEVMSDDVYMLVQDEYKAVREIDVFYKTTENKKTGEKKTKETGWDGKLVPKTLVIEMFFAAEQKAIDNTEIIITAAQAELDETIENAEDGSIINEVLRDNGNLNKQELKKKLKDKTLDTDDRAALQRLSDLSVRVDEGTKVLKDLRAKLDQKTRGQYPKLTIEECLKLLIERKWYRSLGNDIYALYNAVNNRIGGRVTELAERYEQTLPEIETEVAELESKVQSHLERMGFVW